MGPSGTDPQEQGRTEQSHLFGSLAGCYTHRWPFLDPWAVTIGSGVGATELHDHPNTPHLGKRFSVPVPGLAALLLSCP